MHPTTALSTSAVDRYLAHLDGEEAVLTHCRDELQRLLDSIRSGQPTGTLTTDIESAAVHITRAREELAASIPLASDDATLSKIIQRLPAAQAEQVRQRQTTLQRLAQEARQLHVRCSSLMAYCSRYVKRLVAEANPGNFAGPRYGPTGMTLDDASHRGQLLARG